MWYLGNNWWCLAIAMWLCTVGVRHGLGGKFRTYETTFQFVLSASDSTFKLEFGILRSDQKAEAILREGKLQDDGLPAIGQKLQSGDPFYAWVRQSYISVTSIDEKLILSLHSGLDEVTQHWWLPCLVFHARHPGRCRRGTGASIFPGQLNCCMAMLDWGPLRFLCPPLVLSQPFPRTQARCKLTEEFPFQVYQSFHFNMPG